MSTCGDVLLLFARPGAGKGTFSQYFKEQYQYHHISIGDLVRYEIDQETKLGVEAKLRLQSGQLLEENMVQMLICRAITDFSSKKRRFIIDGFPRTKSSLLFLKNFLEKLGLLECAAIVHLQAGEVVCRKRITTRILCKQCGRVYNRIFCPPNKENRCDNCAAYLHSRLYDEQKAIQKRFIDYRLYTEKALALATTFFPLFTVNTEVSLAECISQYHHLYQTLFQKR